MSLAQQYSLQHSELPQSLTQTECAGKTYIVTGSNSGIGFECAKHLVQLGAKRVILAVRSLERGRVAQAQIEADTNRKGVVEAWEFDLSSYKSVVAFAKKAESELDRLDAVIENAAAASASWVTAEGLESTLTINVVSTFLLVVLLMPFLRKCASRFSCQPHIVIVTSSMGFAREADLKKLGNENVLRDLSDDKKWGMNGASRYSLSKLLQMFLVRHLAVMAPVSETGVVINYVCPGLAKTTLSKHSKLSVRVFIKGMQLIMGRSAEWSSRNLLFGIAASEESHGKFLTYCEIREEWLPDFIISPSGKQLSERFWKDLAAELDSIKPGCIEAMMRSP